MQYRELGRTGLEVSAIGLGTEYLINLPQDHVGGVIREAISQGVNYFDMFWAQPQFRDNVGAAFKGYREQVYLTGHLGAAERDGQYERTRDPRRSEQFFLDFLQRLDSDHVDVLFLHNCNPQEDYDKLVKPGGLLDLARRFQEEGKARLIGLSGHNVATALQAVESGWFDVLMFPVNLTSQVVPGIRDLHEACAAHDVGLVAMKPYAGGRLLRQERVIHVEDFQMGRTQMMGAPTRFEKSASITPLQCLAYALSQPGVSTTVPGCKNVDELAAALAYWQATEEERDFGPVISDFEHYPAGQCVYCNHCLPCPSAIDIGQVIDLLDRAQQSLDGERQAAYDALSSKAFDCVQCGDCEARCPFGVQVISRMEQAVQMFESRRESV
jgi:predicted aldo/keto reductase-like oxidoreductase